LNREQAHDDRHAALEQRIDALDSDTDQSLRTLRQGVESKADRSEVELLRTSLLLHGSAISTIGGEATETSRIVTKKLLGDKTMICEGEVESIPFESLYGCDGVISMLKMREARDMADGQEGVEFHRHVI
jgi:hypothetical protein